ncbi:MAG: HAD-IC family P-type ATPase, partial [Oscillospiraceae bacterium]
MPEILGLSQEEAEKRLNLNGQNSLAKRKKSKPLKIFLGQFKDVMVVILLISTVISVFLGEIYDAVTIILIVLINAILGFVQEFRTEKTLEALSRMTAPTAKCYRNGKLSVIPAETLVLDDVIELEAGDKVPADGVLLTSKGVFADEAILTGEAVAVEKIASGKGDCGTVFSGTIITKGHAMAKISATGKDSQMGKISDMLSEIDSEQTPLQKRLAELGKIVAAICIVVCVIVFAAGVLRGEDVFQMLLTGISIAIAAIPEGLPAAVTIALALGVRRMLGKNALVNKLHSVETLGCASIICSDKTGTITENKMTVTKIYTDGNIYDVLGSGYNFSGEICLNKMSINPLKEKALAEILNSAVLCNNAKISTPQELYSRSRGKITQNGKWEVSGDPTEISLLVAAAKCGITAESLKFEFFKADEIPFDSETRLMTIIGTTKSGEKVAYLKGAIDVILPKCGYILTSGGEKALKYSDKAKILQQNDLLTADALRVLAFAKKSLTSVGEADSGLVFLGLIGMLDPPRAEAKRAIKICRRAKIKTVMITGDHKNTAIAVARQAGILFGNSDEKILTGEELDKISDEELVKTVENISVFARVSPNHKLRIVKSFKKCGHIVA